MPSSPSSSSAYKLAFIDLDDTLLGPGKEIDRANHDALDRLRAAGVEIAIASGRHHHNVAALPALAHRDWVLSSHGSVVRHERTGKLLAEEHLPPALALHLCARAETLGICAIVYHRTGAYIQRDSPWSDLYAREAGWHPQRVPFSTLEPTQIQKVIWPDHPDRIQQWAPVMQAELAGRANVLVTNPELLEFFSIAANKAIGAQTLSRSLGVAPEETLAFGDGNNDVELLRWAGLSVAMSHGRESARQAARFISPPGPPESAFARAVDLALTTRR